MRLILLVGLLAGLSLSAGAQTVSYGPPPATGSIPGGGGTSYFANGTTATSCNIPANQGLLLKPINDTNNSIQFGSGGIVCLVDNIAASGSAGFAVVRSDGTEIGGLASTAVGDGALDIYTSGTGDVQSGFIRFDCYNSGTCGGGVTLASLSQTGLNLPSLTASLPVCTDSSKNLTSTCPAGNGSGAEQTISFQPGSLTAVTNTKGVFGKFVKTSTVDNIVASALLFVCAGNPTVTMYECGTDATCATPTTIGSVTVTASGQAFDGSISAATITATHYIAWAISAGTCTSLDVSATAQVHAN